MAKQLVCWWKSRNVERRAVKRLSGKFLHDTIAANEELRIALLREAFDVKLAEMGLSNLFCRLDFVSQEPNVFNLDFNHIS